MRNEHGSRVKSKADRAKSAPAQRARRAYDALRCPLVRWTPGRQRSWSAPKTSGSVRAPPNAAHASVGNRPLDFGRWGIAEFPDPVDRKGNQNRLADRALLGNVAQALERRGPAHFGASGACSGSAGAAPSARARYRLAIAVSRKSLARSASDRNCWLALKNLISGAPVSKGPPATPTSSVIRHSLTKCCPVDQTGQSLTNSASITAPR